MFDLHGHPIDTNRTQGDPTCDGRTPITPSPLLEHVLVEVKQDGLERVGRIVLVGDGLVSRHAARLRVEGSFDDVVGALLPIHRPGAPFESASTRLDGVQEGGRWPDRPGGNRSGVWAVSGIPHRKTAHRRLSCIRSMVFPEFICDLVNRPAHEVVFQDSTPRRPGARWRRSRRCPAEGERTWPGGYTLVYF